MKLPKIPPLSREEADNTVAVKGGIMSKRWFWIFFPGMLLYMELVMRLVIYGKEFFSAGIFYTAIFSLSLGLFLTAICTAFTPKTNGRMAKIFAFLLAVLFGTQAVYQKVFLTFLTLFSMQGAEQALVGFWKSALRGIWQTLPEILLYFVPFALLCIFGKKQLLARKAKKGFGIVTGGASVLLFAFALIIIAMTGKGNGVNTRFIYFNSYLPEMVVERFGVFTNFRLDVEHTLFGIDDGEEAHHPVEASSAPAESSQTSSGEETPPEKVAAVMDIDWDTLIAQETDEDILKMHSYFSTVEPTYENEYTGMFKGKNLILLTAEAFSPYAINKDLTPTLYKMQQEGFDFTNFYTPSWGVSTSDGEYVANVGLIPKTGVWSYYRSGEQGNYMAFSMAHLLSEEGYIAQAYHNNTYTYYKRHISHPNMGYIYKGYGNGLQVKKTWPESDLEMMQLTVDEYINKQPFHVFYMTVSGHMEYTYIDNMMASKHRAEVEAYFGDTKSLAVKAYYACNMELDRALEYLLQRLNEAGIAENTVIALSPDHYPYGLTMEQMDELSGKTLEKTFEIEKGVFLLYCQGQEPVKVDTLACSLDIIPTLCNLFGLDYDSRLLMGADIFSEGTERIVELCNYSWITEKGTYNTKTKEFISWDGTEPEEGYVKRISAIVSNKFRYSTRILDNDYYREVFGADKTSAVDPVPPLAK